MGKPEGNKTSKLFKLRIIPPPIKVALPRDDNHNFGKGGGDRALSFQLLRRKE